MIKYVCDGCKQELNGGPNDVFCGTGSVNFFMEKIYSSEPIVQEKTFHLCEQCYNKTYNSIVNGDLK